MVRGNPAVEGTYVGFVVGENFEGMRVRLSELNTREVVAEGRLPVIAELSSRRRWPQPP